MEISSVLQEIKGRYQRWHETQKELRYRPRPAVMYYLGENPPCAVVVDGDKTYKIHPDGTTFWAIAGMYVPIEGCPAPDVVWRLNTGAFLWRHRKQIPLAVVVLVALVALQFLLSTIPGAPGAAWFLDFFAAGMNATLVGMVLLLAILSSLWVFRFCVRWHLASEDNEMSGLLEAGRIDISPDVHIFSTSDSEQPDTFAQRVRDAYNDMLPHGQYLLILNYRCPSGIIVRSPDTGSQEYFERDSLTKTLPAWAQEVCPPTRFDRETWADFSAYCVAFCEQFRVWSQTDKMKQGNPLKDMLNMMEATARKAAVILALFLCPLFVAAQDLVPVSARALPQTAGQSVFSGSLPDSAEVEKMKHGLLQGKAAIAKETKPTRLFSMWAFHKFILPVLAFFAIIFWIIAKSAFKESEHDYGGNVIFGIGIAERGHWARRCVWAILTCTAIIEISAGIIDDILTKENLWGRFVLWILQAVAAYLVITGLTPNPRKAVETPQGQGGVSFPTTRRLGG